MTNRDLERLRIARAACRTGQARQLRQGAGLSQSEIAAAVGVAQPTVAMWETGQRVPRGTPALRYAAILERLARPATVPSPEAAV